jgi:hypothetical protein
MHTLEMWSSLLSVASKEGDRRLGRQQEADSTSMEGRPAPQVPVLVPVTAPSINHVRIAKEENIRTEITSS